MPEAAGDFTGVGGRQGFQRKLLVQDVDDLTGRHHFIHEPPVGVAHVHELDEAEDVLRSAETPGHGQDFVLIHPAFDDHVDLDHSKPCIERRFHPCQHALHWKIHVVHGPEHGVVQRIETHGDALQSSLTQRPGQAGKGRAIGRERQVLQALDGHEHFDEFRQIPPQQGFAAGDTNFPHSQTHKDA